MIVVLLLGPGLAGREINCLRVAGPGKGVDFVLAGGDGKGLAAVGRNQEKLGDVFVFVIFICLVVCRSPSLASSASLALRLFVPRGTRSTGRRATIAASCRARIASTDQARRLASASRVAVEPEFFAEDLLLPVGSFRFDDYRVAVRRNFHRGEANRVEEFVESELGLCGLGVGKDDWESKRKSRTRGEAELIVA